MDLVYLTAPEAADATKRHPQTIRRALVAGELHGSQRKTRGTWSIKPGCLEAWVENRPCEHKATNVVDLASHSAAKRA